MRLNELKKGDSFIVNSVNIPGEIGKRLCEMGFHSQTTGKVIRKAPLGDPIQIKILNYDISIRDVEAKGVEVTKL